MSKVRNSFGSWPAGIAAEFIAAQEGFIGKARAPVKGDVLTIGYGHTAGVKAGDTITREQAKELLAKDLELYKGYLLRYVNAPVSRNEFIAILSLCYNLGPGEIRRSRFLRKINMRLYEDAAEEIMIGWDLFKGKPLPGLTARRKREQALFLKGDDE